jgi:hypothetical protein
MKLTRDILEQLVEETIKEMALRIVKFSPQEMMQLHQVGQVEKDGVFYQYEEPVHEQKKLDEGKKIIVKTDKGRKIQLDIDNEAKALIDGLKADNKKLTRKNISDYINAEYKFFNSPKLNQQVLNYILKNIKKLTEQVFMTEGKRRELEIHVMDKIKVDKILKKLRLKPGKHYDIGAGSRQSFILDVDVKFLDKLITFLMKNRIRVR